MSSSQPEKTAMTKEVIKNGLHNLARTPDRSSFQFQSLDLSNIRLESINNQISQFTSIRFLDLSNNLIVDILHLQQLSALEDLKLSGNRVKAVPILAGQSDGETPTFPKLRKLHLDQNKIVDLPPAFKLPKLTHLYLSENRLENVASLASITSLTVLDVANNKVKNMQGFKQMPKLKQLYVGGNPIASISGYENLPELKILHLRKCKITDIEEELPELPALEKINLRGNRLSTMEQLKRLFNFPALTDINVLENPVQPVGSSILMLDVLIANTKIERFNKQKIVQDDLLQAMYLAEYRWMESEKERIKVKRAQKAAAKAAAEAQNAQ